MKTIFPTRFLILALTFLLVSFSDPYTIKRITDTNFKYEFYTTDESITPKINKTYYWFKGGAIHNTQGGFQGQLLTGSYVKMYLSNQLAEQGSFADGLRTGLWKTWYENGHMATAQYWYAGLRKGEYLRFDENGVLIEKGSYRNDLKRGEWIDLIKKDTTLYKNDLVVVKKPKKPKKVKVSKEKPKEEATKNPEIKDVEIPKKSKKVKAASKTKPAKETTSKKDTTSNKKGFFTRLFGKKTTK